MPRDTLPLLEQIERVTHAADALAAAVSAARVEVGVLLREQGATAALTVAPTPWVDQFTREVERFAAAGRPFTSEDVTAIVGRPRGNAENKNNAVGALMMRLARRLHLRRTGQTRISTEPRSRGRLLCEWVSGRTA